MGYIQDTLSDSETIIYEARFHWTYYAVGWLALLFLGVFIIGIIFFVQIMMRIWTTEVGVTNHRVIHKTGWISRSTDELELSSVEGVEVEQGIFGRIFGYGRLIISGTGVEDVVTPLIAEPLEFRKAIDEAAHPGDKARPGEDAGKDAPEVASAVPAA